MLIERSSRAAWLATAAVVVLGFAGLSGSAAAQRRSGLLEGASWSVQPTPGPAGADSSQLLGVSCPSASSCTAVGWYFTATSEFAWADHWDGTTWTPASVLLPTGATASVLNEVWCKSASACVAVGASFIGSTASPLVEVWDGASWAIQPVPTPSDGADAQLYGISCTSLSACTAVGAYHQNGAALTTSFAERWNGTTWAVQSVPSPVGATGSQLNAVSCRSAHICTAVGAYTNAVGLPMTLAELWDGTSWVVEATANPVGLGGFLAGVSCSTPITCMAVGITITATFGTERLTEEGVGPVWTIQPALTPLGGGNSFLTGVSCASAIACTAIGSRFDSAGTEVPQAERWNGAIWTSQPIPSPAGSNGSELIRVSCSAANACTAVGDSGGRALVERYS